MSLISPDMNGGTPVRCQDCHVMVKNSRLCKSWTERGPICSRCGGISESMPVQDEESRQRYGTIMYSGSETYGVHTYDIWDEAEP